MTHISRFPEPQHFFAAQWQNWDFAIAIIFYFVKNCPKIRVWPNIWIICNIFAKLVFALKFKTRVLQHPNNIHTNFHKVFITGKKMTAIAKSAKIHPAANECYGLGEPAICRWYISHKYWNIEKGIKVFMLVVKNIQMGLFQTVLVWFTMENLRDLRKGL